MLNKLDLVPEAERKALMAKIRRSLRWRGPLFSISALSGEGTEGLMQAVMDRLDALQQERATAIEQGSASTASDEADDV